MSKFLLYFILLTVPATIPNYVIGARNITRILGGSDASRGQFPFVVSFERHGSHHCAGTLVKTSVILTAAHCFAYGTHGIFAIAGTNNAKDYEVGSQRIKISFVRMHPSSMRELTTNNRNDIAVAFTARAFVMTQYVKVLPYVKMEVKMGAEVTILGWGRINSEGELPSQLQYGRAQVNSFETCGGKEGLDTHKVYCIRGNGKPYVIARQGDSGGPAIYNGHVVGLVSRGVPNDDHGTLYMKLAHYDDWITRILGGRKLRLANKARNLWFANVFLVLHFLVV